MQTFRTAFSTFFGPVAKSYRGELVPAELFRSIVTGLGGSTLVGVLVAVITAIAADSSLIFPNAGFAALVGYVLTQSADQLRRLDHEPTAEHTVDQPRPAIVATPSAPADHVASSLTDLMQGLRTLSDGEKHELESLQNLATVAPTAQAAPAEMLAALKVAGDELVASSITPKPPEKLDPEEVDQRTRLASAEVPSNPPVAG